MLCCYLLPYIGPDISPPIARRGAYFGEGSGPIFLDQVKCSGTETSLLSCTRFSALGLHSCDHSLDAGVQCPGT